MFLSGTHENHRKSATLEVEIFMKRCLKPGQVKAPLATLDELFAYIDSLPRPAIIAIDEFQQICEYGDGRTEALLRTYIQSCRNAHFIFAGSKRHLLSNMFMSYAKPFYQSATLMSLGKIGCEAYCDFSIKLFTDYGKGINRETVKEVYERGAGITWYIQAIMNELFALTLPGEDCTPEKIEPATNNLISARSEYYLETLSRLSDRQKRVLLAVARMNEVREPTSAEFIESWGLVSSSSVQSAMRTLLKNDIITKESDKYRVADIFFAEWLKCY